MPLILAFACGLLLGLCVAAAAWWAGNRTAHSMRDQFRSLAQDALKASQDQFLALSQERFRAQAQEGVGVIDQRRAAIDELVKPVQRGLEVLNSAVEQLKGTDAAIRTDLLTLQRETARLAGALHNPAERGRFGEYVLKRLLDKSGLIEGQHYTSQTSFQDADDKTRRPDVVIEIHDQLRLVLDAKAPIHDVLDALDDPDTHAAAAQKLAQHIRGHVKALMRRDYTQLGRTPDFTILFLPGDYLYALAATHDRTLLEDAADQRVLISSPSLLIGLLRVVVLMARDVETAKNARLIAEAGAELHTRLKKFMEHFEKIGRTLVTLTKAYNDALGSMDRMVLPKARSFEALRGTPEAEGITLPPVVEALPRGVSDPVPLDERAA